VIQNQIQHPTRTRTRPVRDQGRDHPHEPRKQVATRLPARDPHLLGDDHAARPTRNHHHHQGVAGARQTRPLRLKIDQEVRLVERGIRLKSQITLLTKSVYSNDITYACAAASIQILHLI